MRISVDLDVSAPEPASGRVFKKRSISYTLVSVRMAAESSRRSVFVASQGSLWTPEQIRGNLTQRITEAE
ncbi:hypothetical protein AB0C34_31055 [Nocardia sp. NPDC049220]|uniref:hypothetical protein n=1 Tax=Nocardia sp. NPDC049220 TaxID=3155273 RepID=UPI0033E1BC52